MVSCKNSDFSYDDLRQHLPENLHASLRNRMVTLRYILILTGPMGFYSSAEKAEK